jgi:hypothetical protein
MEYKVGSLLFSKGSLYRVIFVGTDSMQAIEYNSTSNEFEGKTYTLIKDQWYRWKNDGTGEKISFTSMGTIAPNKIPQPVHSFNQLETASSLIIKGTAYKIVEDTSLTVPGKWAGQRIFNLSSGKKPAMVALEALERKSIFDKAANCEFLLDGNISRLSEADIILITEV